MLTKRRAAQRLRRMILFAEPVEAAKAASLRHVSDDRPGIRRKRSGSGFSYRGPDGEIVRDKSTLSRIRALAIPPAWTDVWICTIANGHIQATGRDARGRKQYRYHQRWREVRDATKYERMVLFGHTLPRIRSRVDADLALPGLPRDKLLATIVRLLETTFKRVGNEEYARTNGSFGLTTLMNRHVAIEGARLRFSFRGKSGKVHVIRVNDRRLAGLVRRCRELPGQDLFQYLDDAGEPQPITSADVNDYLRLVSDQEFTAKDFRTWAGTQLAASNLAEARAFDPDVNPKSALVSAVESVAEQLGNTVAICRKCYIHPSVLDAYENRELFDFWMNKCIGCDAQPGLSAEETALLAFLEKYSTETL
jgi:DNA topoisomerase-1